MTASITSAVRRTGFDGQETNVVEQQIDYVIGSGNHARSYLHRSPDGKLIELPVSWYIENSGYWAMSPGYDRKGQEDFRRAITGECLLCHNGLPLKGSYPERGNTGLSVFPKEIPQGIDCQRCHGPGGAHVRAALAANTPREQIRQAIVNPARLSRERQLEVCMQCHLETSSSLMPNEIRRYNRTIDSYRPGEPLGDYKLYFDRAASPENARPVRDRACRLPLAHVRLFSFESDDVPHLPRSSPVLPHFDLNGSLPGCLPGLPSVGRP